MKRKHDSKNGFTIVEIIVVVITIGILVGISVVGYGQWQKSTTEKVVKSDLIQAAAAMENARNFGLGYPTSLPSTFSSSKDVSVVYVSGSATEFCLNGTSTKQPAIKLRITNVDKSTVQNGSC